MNSDPSEYEMTAEDVQDRRRNDDELTLIDIRRPRERKVASIGDELWIEMEDVPANIEEIDATERPVVIYCHHGMRSLKVTKFLRENGIDEVYSLAGGIDYWAHEIDSDLDRY